MNRSTRLSLALTAAVALAAAASWRPAPATTTDPSKKSETSKIPAASGGSRRITFTYEVYYDTVPKDRQVFDFWIPLPAEDESQKIKDMVITAPYAGELTSEPENGNRVFHFRSGPRGGSSLNITLRFTAERQEVRFGDLSRAPAVPKDPPANLARYLKGDQLVPINDETKSLAAQVTKGMKTPAEKARAIYNHVVSTLKYDKSGEGWGRGDFRYIVGVKSGNCADLGAAFTGLARAAGIPARQVMGFKIPRTGGTGTLSEYHCWSEFFLDGLGWIPVDCAEAARNPSLKDTYFGWIDPDRIQFSVGRDVTLAPPQNGDPINFWLYPYAEGDGQPLTGSAYRFTWKDAPASAPAPAGKPASSSPGL